jgi:hypothetical protein
LGNECFGIEAGCRFISDAKHKKCVNNYGEKRARKEITWKIRKNCVQKLTLVKKTFVTLI